MSARRLVFTGILAILVALAGGVGWWYSKTTNSNGPVGIVIPHHDMVASARQAYLADIATTHQPETIVLLSPDHFEAGKEPIIASTREWQTTNGLIYPNRTLVEQLQITVDEAPFDGEHGVTSLLGDLQTYFPSSTLLPILIGRDATYALVEDLVRRLYNDCPDCLLVASVDFSHTVQSEIAALHDRLALRALSQRDPVALYKHAEVDSPESLTALALWAELHDAQRFEVFTHTNSGHISGKTVGEMTTHIIGGYTKGPPITTYDHDVTLMFAGDTMFTRSVATTHHRSPRTAITKSLGERFFWGVDGAIVNLEGVFSTSTNKDRAAAEFPPRLLFDPAFATALRRARITSVGLANNHSLDDEVTGTDYTRLLLNEHNIQTIGYPRNDENAITRFAVGNTNVAVVAASLLEPQTNVIETVRNETARGYRVIAFMHWGREYEAKPTAEQEVVARDLVAAGAELIVGSHPHVIQPVSVVDGVPVVYSLGNFLFDQTDPATTQTGLVLGVVITPTGSELTLVPIDTVVTPHVLPDKQSQRIIASTSGAWQTFHTENNWFSFPRPLP